MEHDDFKSERDAAVSRADELESDNSNMERKMASLPRKENDELKQALERLKQEKEAADSAEGTSNARRKSEDEDAPSKTFEESLDGMKELVASLEKEKGKLVSKLKATTADCDVAVSRADKLARALKIAKTEACEREKGTASVTRVKEALAEALAEARVANTSLVVEKGQLASKLKSTMAERDEAISRAAKLESENKAVEAVASKCREKEKLLLAELK